MFTAYRPSKPLQAALGFSNDDLTANQAGRLSEHQIALLRQSARPFWRLMRILGVFAVLVGAPLLLFAGSSPDAPILFLLTIMVPGGLGIIFVVRLAGIYASIGDGQVLAAEGLAETYTKHAYRGGVTFYVRVGEQEFFVNRDLQLAFEAGSAYRVFFTPKGRIIVSGELAPEPSPETVASRLLTAQLARALAFSREDLDANRAGRISAAQSARLRGLRKRELLLGVVSAAIAAGAAALLPQVHGGTWQMVFWTLILLIAVAFAVVVLWNAVRRSRDLRSGEVAVASGPLQREAANTGSVLLRPTYFLRAGGVRLHVPLAVYGAFADGGHYALYHAPHSRILVSAEPLDAPTPAERRPDSPCIADSVVMSGGKKRGV